jgi:hypothetical protein
MEMTSRQMLDAVDQAGPRSPGGWPPASWTGRAAISPMRSWRPARPLAGSGLL